MKIFLKTEDEINQLRAASQLASTTLAVVGRHVVPGRTPCQLRGIAEKVAHQRRCLEVEKRHKQRFDLVFFINGRAVDSQSEAVVELKEGDILSVECRACLGGFYSLCAYTFGVGHVSKEVASVMQTAIHSLNLAIKRIVAGHHLCEIGRAIQTRCKLGNVDVCDAYGHGIGRSVEELPKLTLSSSVADHLLLKSGMCLSIVPTVRCSTSSELVQTKPIKFTSAADDLCAKYGHTVVVRQDRAEILTSFSEINSI